MACAPTGSGKTVLFELAIIRLLMETTEPWRNVKAVYMAPIKALCSQRFEDWNKKFGPLGLSCKELTGDTEIDDFFEIQDANIIITTPEKWDSMTRKWRDNCLLQLVRLFLIDEIVIYRGLADASCWKTKVSLMEVLQSSTWLATFCYHRKRWEYCPLFSLSKDLENEGSGRTYSSTESCETLSADEEFPRE